MLKKMQIYKKYAKITKFAKLKRQIVLLRGYVVKLVKIYKK